ncbi:MAG: phosphoribosylglycinamide formyltransferase [Alphaproteobacteria bacterium]|tara:strand:+ start:1074 stop:1658 length:585 start_codon:yes stop_codon:yes gene_type:complete
MGFKIAILISGRGSNMLNIIEACNNKKLYSSVNLVVSNRPNVLGLKVASKYKVRTEILDSNNLTKENFESLLDKILKKNNINLVCLAGFMKILSKDFVKKWPKMILNIHPSILPSFKGLNAQRQAIENKAKYSGCTVHFVNEEMDSGEIIDQKIVSISNNDDVDSLSKKILMEEHKLYIKVLKELEKNCGKNEQ